VNALKAYPNFNASLSPDGDSLILKNYYNIGFACDTPDGLVVPVVRDVHQKDVLDIARDLMELSAKARERKLKIEEMQGAALPFPASVVLAVRCLHPLSIARSGNFRRFTFIHAAGL